MASKVLVFVLLVCAASCQQQEEEDDGSYNPEKYEKPYLNLVDVNPPEESTPTPNQFQSTFQQSQQPQQFETFQQPQQIQPFQQAPPNQPFQEQIKPSQPFQQSNVPPFQPQRQQPNPFFEQLQNTPPSQPTETSRTQPQNPFPQNPFFQRLLNPAPQPQVPSFQQPTASFPPQNPSFRQQNSVPQNAPAFQQTTPSFQPQPEPSFPPSFRDVAPVNQIVEDLAPLKSTNYKTNDHQRTEVIDNEGNVKGEYSYIDPNGKTITVRYSAGKDGFKVEGDNIPKTPGSQPQLDQPEPQPQPLPQPQFFEAQPVTPQFNSLPRQFSAQQPRFNDAIPQQFLNQRQNRPQLRPQFQRRNNQAPIQFTQQTPFNLQDEIGSYEFQSSFQ